MRAPSHIIGSFLLFVVIGLFGSRAAGAHPVGEDAAPTPSGLGLNPETLDNGIIEVSGGGFLGLHEGLTLGGVSGSLRILFRTSENSYWGLMLEPAVGARGQDGTYASLGLIGYRYQARYMFLDLLPLVSATDDIGECGDDPDASGCSDSSGFQMAFKARVGAVLRWQSLRVGISMETMISLTLTLGVSVFLGVGF